MLLVKLYIIAILIYPQLAKLTMEQRGYFALGGEFFVVFIGPVIVYSLYITGKEWRADERKRKADKPSKMD